ncbi:VOC family protein [Candidatus Spongiisocius sp.]|uniref:VOC family protein n=1 Tax=Candidatus Spongiisocius sp. TaxID=3101273 RepID=UPI003B5CBA55
MSIELPEMHHFGIVVPDLDGAMDDLSSQLGLTWAPVRHGERTVRHHGRLVTTDLRLTYSMEGPPHLELIGQARGTPWEPTGGGIHHAGFWVPDLRGAGRLLARAGMTLEATYDAEDGGLLGFAYFTDVNGFRVEILDDSRRQSFDEWLAGGPGHIAGISHTALAVPDLETAMSFYGDALGLTWARPQQRAISIRVAAGDLTTEIRFTYSRQGPPHLELIEGAAGTVWAPVSGLHHIGLWSHRLEIDAARLQHRGMSLEVAGLSRSGRQPSGFTYHRSAHGLRVELVDTASQPAFERWFAGGDLR